MIYLYLYLTLHFLIVIHELGHFVVSKSLDIDIDNVQIGRGFRVFKINLFGVPVIFRFFPYGGKHLYSEQSSSLKGIFIGGKGYFQSYILLLSGVLSSAIFAFILLVAASQVGIWSERVIIGDVSGFAEKAGFKSGDYITRIAGNIINNKDDVRNHINNEILNNHAAARVTLSRAGKSLKTTLILPEKTYFTSKLLHRDIGIEFLGNAHIYVVSSKNDTLKEGDIITQINDLPITSFKSFKIELTQEKVRLNVTRGEWSKTIEVFPDNASIGIMGRIIPPSIIMHFTFTEGLGFAAREMANTLSNLIEILLDFFSINPKINLLEFEFPNSFSADYVLRLTAMMLLIHIMPNLLLPGSDGWRLATSLLKTQLLYNKRVEFIISYVWYTLIAIFSVKFFV